MMIQPPGTHRPAMLPQEASLLKAILPAQRKRAGALAPVVQAESAQKPLPDAACTYRHGSYAGRAVLHTDGIALPGVQAMARRKKDK